jgi:hypothetical protein
MKNIGTQLSKAIMTRVKMANRCSMNPQEAFAEIEQILLDAGWGTDEAHAEAERIIQVGTGLDRRKEYVRCSIGK